MVSVPVLSKTMWVLRCRVSSTWGRTTSTPRRSRRSVAAASALGVASDSAHGHDTTSTAIAIGQALAGSAQLQ